MSNLGLSCSDGQFMNEPPRQYSIDLCVFLLFEAGRRPSAKPAEERLGGAKLDFAKQIGREDLESGKNPDASGTQAFQAEHLPPLCQTEMVTETLATRQANGRTRRRLTRGNCPMSFNGVKLPGKVELIILL